VGVYFYGNGEGSEEVEATILWPNLRQVDGSHVEESFGQVLGVFVVVESVTLLG
jgi:hypothetical protein